jgi:acyl-CoA synthetase (AMP-forming)/AMP-acid ligase II
MLLDDEKTKNNLQQIRNVIIGGAELPYSLKQKIKPFANNIYETFGMTETVSHIAMKLLSKNNEEDFFRTIGSVTVSTNENNCLLIYAPHLQEETIVTNDVVEIIDSKTFKWLGRLDNVINSGGIKLYAETIEQKIKKVLGKQMAIAKTQAYGEGLFRKLMEDSSYVGNIVKKSLSWHVVQRASRYIYQLNAAILNVAFKLVPSNKKSTASPSLLGFSLENGDYALVRLITVHEDEANKVLMAQKQKFYREKLAKDFGQLDYRLYTQALLKKAKLIISR